MRHPDQPCRRSPFRWPNRLRFGHIAIFVAILSAILEGANAADPSTSTAHPGSRAVSFEDAIQPLLATYCLECHSGDEPKGKLDLERLGTEFDDDATQSRWLAVRRRLRAGEMPPPPGARPTSEEALALTDWIDANVAHVIDERRATQGRVVARRMSRTAYQNTVCDLLGVSVDLADLLPEDATGAEFDNVGAGMHVSSFLMERYLAAARTALDSAIANGPRPPLIDIRYLLRDERQFKIDTERVYLDREDALVFFSSSDWNSINLSQFYPPHRGRYRFRISAYGYASAGKPVPYRVDAGPMLMGTKQKLVGYFDALPDQPRVLEFTIPLEARSLIRIQPYGLATAHVVSKIGAADYQGPGLAVQWVDVMGPLHDDWPPASHRGIFGTLEQVPVVGEYDRFEVVSPNPVEDAERIVLDFAGRAFRRPVTKHEIEPILDLAKSQLAAGRSFERACRLALEAILISPDFLFLFEPPGPLDDYALASRLSYFLWNTAPDATLLELAAAGKLRDPNVLSEQVDRLARDERSGEFIREFVGQWLGLRDIDFTEPSGILYPEFDQMLKVSMVREAELFFAELLRDDLSLANFVSSDFSMLNGRLAEHYGVPGPPGFEFAKTPLPADSHRGGALTMAGVLKVSANGTSTSPVTRGAWVSRRIMGVTPPPPPPDVPALEPDIRGAKTIREQLAKHRQIESCANCHAHIDPPGFALESFDVIGGWREHYRTTGLGEPVTVRERTMPYLSGPAVDPSGECSDGREFANIDDLKRLLLADMDKIARALAIRLVTYATGEVPTEADVPRIEAIVRRAAEKNHGLRSLIQEIVRDDLFRTK